MEKGRLIIDGVDVSGSVGSAASVPYSNTNSGLEATNVQGAIDELNSNFIQWWIEKGFLPNPLTNRLSIMSNGILLNNQNISTRGNQNYSVTFENITDALQINFNKTTSNNVGATGFAVLDNPLDLTNYKKLHLVYDTIKWNGNGTIIPNSTMGDQFSFRTSLENFKYGATSGDTSVIKPTQIKLDVGNMYTEDIDLSDLTGLYYFGISQGTYTSGQHSLTINLRDIWLE